MTPNPEIVRWRWCFFGRVQGVGFRAFCCQAAEDSGVAGWVKNEPDGSVTCEAQGEAPVLADLKDRLRSGNLFARVDRVEEILVSPRPGPVAGFDIIV